MNSYFLYFKTKMNAQNQMAVATKNVRTIREVTAALVDMASCYRQTGKRAKVDISVLLMSEQILNLMLVVSVIFYLPAKTSFL